MAARTTRLRELIERDQLAFLMEAHNALSARNTPTDVFRVHGFGALIWANHLLRSSIAAMQATAAAVIAEEGLAGIEPCIAPLAEVFRLQRMHELEATEQRYLPAAPGGLAQDRVRRRW